MSLFLRIIRRNRWAQEFWDLHDYDWLDKNDIPIEPLFDILAVDKNGNLQKEISVWYIHDDKSNLERIIAALAASRSNIDVFDYLLIEEGIITSFGFKLKKIKGETADKHANENWHYNINHLSGFKLVNLIKEILTYRKKIIDFNKFEDDNIDRKTAKEIKKLINKARCSNWINPSEIKVSKSQLD